MGIMAIYINWMYFSYAMAVAGMLGEGKVSYAKQEDLKVHLMKGSWRSGNSVELLVFVVFSHCELLGISFFQPSCCGYHFITSHHHHGLHCHLTALTTASCCELWNELAECG